MSTPDTGATQPAAISQYRLRKPVTEVSPLIQEEYVRGESNPIIDTLSLTTGSLAQAFYPNVRRLVRKAIIQNISTENVTLGTSKNTNVGIGIILNAAAAGQGGGSMPVYNIDLSKMYFVRASAGVTLAIYIED